MSMQTILRTLFVSAICALGACGGGGSGNSGSSNTTGTSSTPNPAFAPLNHWTVPTGPRIDVSAQNLFPFSIGDSITYDRKTAAGTNGTVVRTIVPTTGAQFAIAETDSTSPQTDETKYVVGSFNGEIHIQVQDPLGASGVALGLYNMVPVLEEYVTPLYPAGGARELEAQGALGLDGQGDSFRFVYAQVFVGFETLTILGATRQVAHFRNTASLTVRSASAGTDSTVTQTEDTYFAPNIGLVKRDFAAVFRDGLTLAPAYSIEARSASIGGVVYP